MDKAVWEYNKKLSSFFKWLRLIAIRNGIFLLEVTSSFISFLITKEIYFKCWVFYWCNMKRHKYVYKVRAIGCYSLILSQQFGVLGVFWFFFGKCTVILKKCLKTVVRKSMVRIRQHSLCKSFKKMNGQFLPFCEADTARLNIIYLSHHGKPRRGGSFSFTVIHVFKILFISSVIK